MIRSDKIKTAFTGLVGFRDSGLTGYNIVSTANKASSSGLYYNDASELVTIPNIKDSQENPAISDNDFNALLTNMQSTVALDSCMKVVEGQSDFISSTNLFPFEKSFNRTVDKKSKFVGFEIQPLANGIACAIPWVELSFDSVVTFNLYLYNSNLPKTAIQTKSVTTVAGESKIYTLDWIIADDATYKGGKFYLGYFEEDLGSASAYKKDYDFGNVSVRTPYFYVEPVSLDNTSTTLDIESQTYESDEFGLNIGLDVYTDYTELLIRNKALFARAIQYQMHEKVLLMIKYSTRTNSQERIGKEVGMIDFELFGNAELRIDGVQAKLNKEILSLKKALFRQPKISRGTLH